MNYESQIRTVATDLLPGQRMRTVCPLCQAQHEKSLSITRDRTQPHKLWCKCFRGTCGESFLVVDRVGVRMVLLGTSTEDVAYKELPEHRKMPPSFLSWLSLTYHLNDAVWTTQGCRYEPENRTLCMPWLDVSQHQKGWVEKRFKGPHKSNHTLVHAHPSRLAFPRIAHSYKNLPGGSTVVLVEDLVSAYKVLEYAPSDVYSVALLGADISALDAALLGKLTQRVVVLLDHDQWPKGAIRVLRRLRPYVEQVVATTLDCDPKDCLPGRLGAFLETLEESFP